MLQPTAEYCLWNSGVESHQVGTHILGYVCVFHIVFVVYSIGILAMCCSSPQLL